MILAELARALRPGGRLAVSAFSAYFPVRDLGDGDDFDAEAGVNHERTEVRDEAGAVGRPADLWTTCFTPRELRLLAGRGGLEVEHLWSVTPGALRPGSRPRSDTPEFLARRPPTVTGSGPAVYAARRARGACPRARPTVHPDP